jgi:hypothetical protein
MSRKKGLTLEQHHKMAAEIIDMCKKTWELQRQICPAYGLKSQECLRVVALHNEILRLKAKMDTAYFRENPKAAMPSPYYPVQDSFR